ncbi:hypothetical protein HG536_0A08980 [Torulaspora globosa]|uniref:Uncharacterized protein n=1 Tax=Torulaspora globosa TaxID=48254 RepID=A0A7G3ZC45_9SACH|nr:uncharacterized protein HG536_0A08980 [Torulaspora globosa]QLL31081.1 hypothetical protein HG536_0A08980 [Torulaspora globosa]
MSQANAKLSSRVMNMKFMKFSQPERPNGDDKKPGEEPKQSAVPDNSRWELKSLPRTKKLRKKTILPRRRMNVRSDVSITDVKRESNPIVRGRRTVGEADHSDSTKRSSEGTEDDDYDLDKILKQVKTPR